MKFKYFIPAIVVMIIIFMFSSQNGSESSSLSDSILFFLHHFVHIEIVTTIFRKLAHVFEYLILSFAFYYAFYKNNCRHSLLYTFLCVFFYACSDEIHQLFVSGREGKLLDVCIDMIGYFISLLIIKRRN